MANSALTSVVASARAPLLQPRRVLLADDDGATREGLAELLILAGFEVAQAVDGKDALDRLEHGDPPDLLVCDLDMPRLSGDRLIRRLRLHPRFASLPVVVISARPELLDQPVAAALTKPLQPPLFLRTVRRVLRSR